MALAAVSFVTDYWLPLRRGEETDLTGVLIILTMVSLSGLLRFWQEFRTNKAAQGAEIDGSYYRHGIASWTGEYRRGAGRDSH
ncbi:Magnesium transporting ATPase, P-type 1 [Salmonella enterica subsp. arizonae]|uniref:Magnesium transporting ATPase, P-type 1 n=1 Tax=Salmonella enterica subsp. arizonae TaxID=59203 RepID=A0A379SMK5_SALER|nr:Magnesium transporting ATPase, P-type 1 [Salmonella enterica subsp. arizonae]